MDISNLDKYKKDLEDLIFRGDGVSIVTGRKTTHFRISQLGIKKTTVFIMKFQNNLYTFNWGPDSKRAKNVDLQGNIEVRSRNGKNRTLR